MRRTLASAVAASLVSLAAPARAEDETFTLRVESISGCPSEAEVRDAVTSRLGFDGFAASGATPITVTFTREGAGHAAHVRVGDRPGPTRKASACRDLLAPTAVTLVVLVDPLGTRSRSPSPSPSPPAPAPEPEPLSPPPAPAPAPAPEPPSPSLLELSAGPFVAIGVTPSLTAGAEVALAWRSAPRGPSLALAIDGTLPGETSTPPATVSGQLVSGSLLPCLDVGPITPCARLQAGALFGRGEGISRPRVDRSGYMAAGARIGGRWSLSAAWVVELHADLDVQITRASFEVDGVTLWRAPLLAGGLGAAVGFQR